MVELSFFQDGNALHFVTVFVNEYMNYSIQQNRRLYKKLKDVFEKFLINP